MISAGAERRDWVRLKSPAIYKRIIWSGNVVMGTRDNATTNVPSPAETLTTPEPEPELEVGQASTTPSRHRRRRAVTTDVGRSYTLKVAAVIALGSGSGQCSCFAEGLIHKLHPMILTERWSPALVSSHLRFYTKEQNQSTGRATLSIVAEPQIRLDDLPGPFYCFDSADEQMFRYRQMIFEQRARIHRNVVTHLRQVVDSKPSSNAANSACYQTMALHARAAGLETQARHFAEAAQ